MKWDDVFCHTFKALRLQLGLVEDHTPMVTVSYDSDLCQEAVGKGWLTPDQMRHAADRYRLGKSRSGKCIYWMYDEMMQLRDGHLGDQWVMQLLKARQPELLKDLQTDHCLFGQHLLTLRDEVNEKMRNEHSAIRHQPSDISIVESERTAVILSELFPEATWMAYVYAVNMTPDLMEPLQGHKVTIFPRTDVTLDTYLSFLEFADGVRRLYDIDIAVDNTLEQYASPSQKERGIDLLDFLFEGQADSPDAPDHSG